MSGDRRLDRGAAGAAAGGGAVAEPAYAKVNLVLRVGRPRPDGLHPLCSLFASLDLADELRAAPREPPPPADAVPDSVLPGTGAGDPGAAAAPPALDEVVCPGVDGDNLVAAALAAFRAAAPDAALPPLRVEVDKRIPVAAGLAGGSADAAAALRAANALAGAPLSADRLRTVAAGLGSDVPSQVEPAHALVQGVGERVERVHLPAMTLVLVPQQAGLSTAAVYGELDRIGGHAAGLDPEPLRALAAGDLAGLAAGVANDLQPAALSLRPELAGVLDALRETGALAAQVTGSGPTAFGLFADRPAAERAAAGLPGAIVAEARS